MSPAERIEAISRLRVGIARLVAQIEEIERNDPHYAGYCERMDRARQPRIPLEQFYRLVQELRQLRQNGQGTSVRARGIERLLILPPASAAAGDEVPAAGRRDGKAAAGGAAEPGATAAKAASPAPAVGASARASDARVLETARPLLARVLEDLAENNLVSALAGLSRIIGLLGQMQVPDDELRIDARLALETLSTLDEHLAAGDRDSLVVSLQHLDKIDQRAAGSAGR